MTFDEIMELPNEEILAGDFKAELDCTSPLLLITKLHKFSERFSKYNGPKPNSFKEYHFTNGTSWHKDNSFYSYKNFKEYKRNWTEPRITNPWVVSPKAGAPRAVEFHSYFAEHVSTETAKTPTQCFTVLVVPHLKTCSFLTESKNKYLYPFSKLAQFIQARNEKKIELQSIEQKRKFILEMLNIDISGTIPSHIYSKCLTEFPSAVNGYRLTIFTVLKKKFGSNRIEICADADAAKPMTEQKVSVRVGTSLIKGLSVDEAVDVFTKLTDGRIDGI